MTSEGLPPQQAGYHITLFCGFVLLSEMVSPCSPGWPSTHGSPAALASAMLGQQTGPFYGFSSLFYFVEAVSPCTLLLKPTFQTRLTFNSRPTCPCLPSPPTATLAHMLQSQLKPDLVLKLHGYSGNSRRWGCSTSSGTHKNGRSVVRAGTCGPALTTQDCCRGHLRTSLKPTESLHSWAGRMAQWLQVLPLQYTSQQGNQL